MTVTLDESTRPTIAARFVHGAVSLSVLAACVGVYVWLGTREAPQRRKPPRGGATVVLTEPVRVGDGSLTVHSRGVVVPSREVRVAAEVGGRVEWKSQSARAGHVVTAGDSLLRIESEDYQLTVDQLKAEVAAREAELASLKVRKSGTDRMLSLAEEDVALAQRESDRLGRLRRSGAGTETAFDAAERNLLTARTKVAELVNAAEDQTAQETLIAEQIALAEANLRRAELDLERTSIAAPVDGVVVSDVAEESDYVPAGSTVLTIQETDIAEVQCDLSFEDLMLLEGHVDVAGDSRDLRPDGRPEVTLPRVPALVRLTRGGRTFEWDGRLDGQEGFGLDETTRTITCRITVDDPLPVQTEEGVRPPLLRGLFVDVLLKARPDSPTLVVPLSAVRPGGRLWLDRDGKLAIEEVRMLAVEEQTAVIAADGPVGEGDRVIVSPLGRPVPGMPLADADT